MTCTAVRIHAWKNEQYPDGTTGQEYCEADEAEGWCVYELHTSDDPRQSFDLKNEMDWTGPDAAERSFAMAVSLAERLGVPVEEY